MRGANRRRRAAVLCGLSALIAACQLYYPFGEPSQPGVARMLHNTGDGPSRIEVSAGEAALYDRFGMPFNVRYATFPIL